MRVLVLNTSPKKKGGASSFFSACLKPLLAGCDITTYRISNQSDYKEALELIQHTDVVIISGPLYVDGISSHMLIFLQQAEKICQQKACHFKLYVLCNSGFIEGIQSKLQLNMYEAWCRRAGVEWGGGMGIGGGVCMYFIALFTPISFIIRSIMLGGDAIQMGKITPMMAWNRYSGILINIVFLAGLIICDSILAYKIRTGKSTRNLYTRPIMPSIVFLAAADLIMFVVSLCKGGRLNTMFKRISLEEAVKCTFQDH